MTKLVPTLIFAASAVFSLGAQAAAHAGAAMGGSSASAPSRSASGPGKSASAPGMAASGHSNTKK